MRTFDFMKQFFVLAALAPASGGSAPSRWADPQRVTQRRSEVLSRSGSLSFDRLLRGAN